MVNLIIESGSSHSTWVILNDKVIETQQLPGINPTAMPESIQVIEAYSSTYKEKIDKIFYYGSGVSSQQKAEQIRGLLSVQFPIADIEVVSDIVAACRSFDSPGLCIVSILGTGVNTVLYDGKNIKSSIRSLGYLIDEEGSGFNIGRLIIKRFLRSEMQKTDRDLFTSTYNLNPTELISDIYNHTQANFLIASYSKFLNKSTEELRNEILNENFNAYALNHIQKIDNYRDYNINFVGSIAYVFREELVEAMHEIGATIGEIIQSPIEGLIKYHIKY
ncbi:hypothetical protein N9L92_02180 [Saprospiraceae bacterium]|nr:hypothetical protein [Saprospiraceae bacterium]